MLRELYVSGKEIRPRVFKFQTFPAEITEVKAARNVGPHVSQTPWEAMQGGIGYVEGHWRRNNTLQYALLRETEGKFRLRTTLGSVFSEESVTSVKWRFQRRRGLPLPRNPNRISHFPSNLLLHRSHVKCRSLSCSKCWLQIATDRKLNFAVSAFRVARVNQISFGSIDQ